MMGILFDQDDWTMMASCREHPRMEMWFSHIPDERVIAMSICEECPVREECLVYALDNRIEEGIWGAASEETRKRMLVNWRKHG